MRFENININRIYCESVQTFKTSVTYAVLTNDTIVLQLSNNLKLIIYVVGKHTKSPLIWILRPTLLADNFLHVQNSRNPLQTTISQFPLWKHPSHGHISAYQWNMDSDNARESHEGRAWMNIVHPKTRCSHTIDET